MTSKKRSQSSVALIVMAGLVVFSLAQLSWWTVFHFGLATESKQLQLDILSQRGRLIANVTNQSFARISRLAFDDQLDRDQRLSNLNRLLADPVMLGYATYDAEGRPIDSGGEVDSTFYAAADGIVVYFNPIYPAELLAAETDLLTFEPGDGCASPGPVWVVSAMFKVPTAYIDELDDEAHGRVIMFASEGSVFLLIMLLGAFHIYRSLRRSEELKLQQTNFVRAVTHEFNTPLTSLKLYLETLQSGKVDSAKAPEFYVRMLDDCERLGRLVDNVMQAGQFGQEAYRPKLSPASLSDDLGEYLDSLEPLVTRHHGTMTRSLEPDLNIRSDYQALGRVIRALVDNALKYSPPARRQIEVTLKRDGRFAVIAIADNGFGLPSGEHRKVFDRFYRVGDADTRAIHGTGLGLFLVKQIVEAHRGKVSVVSDGPDQGCTFTLKFKLVEP